MSSRPKPASITTARKILYSAFTVVVFFALVELVLALVGIRPRLVEEDPYVGFSSRLRLFQATADSTVLETAANKLALFNRQTFAREKRSNAFRIFTVGGSTTYGRPFDDSTSFSGWLRGYLKAVAPHRSWEVINCGGISYASYRVATLMEELVGYEPDLFIIYSGHNEFLEKRTYGDLIEEPPELTGTRLLLEHSRLWALGRRIADAKRQRARRRYELSGEVQELLDSSAGLDYYHRDDEFTTRVLEHYRFNLGRMVRLARSAGAGVMLVTLPVNEKDFSPFKSQHREGLGADRRDEHADLRESAVKALDEGDWGAARDLAAEAVAMDPRYAEGQYLLGRAQLALGLSEDAALSFERAIVEDVCPLRALPGIQRSILEMAGNDVVVVDFRQLLRQRMRELAGHSILGDEFFLDHVHPTVETNGELARALVDRMRGMGIVEAPDDWYKPADEAVRSEILAKLGPEAYARAHKNLSKVLIWAGKTREAEKYVKLAEEVLTEDWELHHNAGVIQLEAGEIEQAIASFREATRLDPGAAIAWDRLSSAYSMVGQLEDAIEAGRRAVALDPGAARAWNNLGQSLNEHGDTDESLSATARAVALDPDFAEARNHLGNLHFAGGELDRALASYRRAIELRPGFVEAMANRALVLGEQGRYGEAVEGFTAAIRLDPGLVSAHYGRAQAMLASGDLAAAIADFQRVTELDSKHVDGWENLARCLVSTGQAAAAIEALERGIEANMGAANLHLLNGAIDAEAGRFDDAAQRFATAIELAPDLVQAWIDLAQVRMAENRVEDALEVFGRALVLHQGSDQLHYRVAVALLGTGRIDDGLSHLEEAVRLNPDNVDATRDLATAYQRLGRQDRAAELYRRLNR